jgi:hypothetical protein
VTGRHKINVLRQLIKQVRLCTIQQSCYQVVLYEILELIVVLKLQKFVFKILFLHDVPNLKLHLYVILGDDRINNLHDLLPSV